MTALKVGAQDLANTRFALSPMAELVAALMVFSRGRRPPWLGAWIDRHRADYRALVAEPVLAALTRLLRTTHWIPDFITPPPSTMDTTLADELAVIRATPLARARADLALSAGGRLPDGLDHPDVVDRIADGLATGWASLLAPQWSQRRALLERDVIERAGQLATYGWARALDGLGSNVRWIHNGQIRVNDWDRPPLEVAGARLVLVPNSFGAAWLALNPPQAYALVYQARGLARPVADGVHHRLGRLIGGSRASLLQALAVPGSTTQLASTLGMTIGAVGDHLAVLHDNGLVTKARAGRSVLYQRTPIGDALATTIAGTTAVRR